MNTPTLLASGADTTDGTSFLTASVTPIAGNLTLLCVVAADTTAPETPSSVSGCGLTWTLIATQDFVTDNKRIALYRACGTSPTTGQITITYLSTKTIFAYSIVNIPGTAAAPASNGSTGIKQIKGNAADAATSLTLTFTAAFSNPNNGGIAFFVTDANAAVTPDGSWTEFASGDVGGSTPTMRIETQWVGSSVSAASASFSSADAGGLAVEIAIASGDTKHARGVGRGIARGVA